MVATKYPLTAVHEGVHVGLLWAFSGEWPLVSIRGSDGYAYAAAPNWWFPRNDYLVVGLTPLALLTPLLLALLRKVPAWAVPALGWAIVRNVSGSHADLYVAWQLLHHPAHCYLNDTSEVFTFWEPVEPQ